MQGADTYRILSTGTKGQEWVEGKRKLPMKLVEERETMDLYLLSVPLSHKYNHDSSEGHCHYQPVGSTAGKISKQENFTSKINFDVNG